MKKNNAQIPLIVGFAVALGILIGSTLNFKNKAVYLNASSKEAKIKRLLNYIEYDYVDKVNTDSLLDDAITNMLTKLDPHSVYISKNELKQVTETMQGKFVGIGVSFIINKDSVVVTNVIPEGPSKKAGVQDGDRIIIADNDTLYGPVLLKKAMVNSTLNHSFEESRKISSAVIETLKGEPGTSVTITVFRRSVHKKIEIPIIRGEVPIESVISSYLIDSTLGYININRFARTTFDEFKKALDSLKANGMKALVLDLRGNPGGFMDIAEKIVDEFLPDGNLIVFTKNKTGEVDKFYATEKGDFETGHLYVLIDQNSASASEIVAGALQDNDRGTIVGRRSFGKGLVQQEMSLGDGSAVRLTTSRYYTPTGRSIQKPYKDEAIEKYNNDYLERIHNGELYFKDSIKINQKLKFTTPKGKVVYGGGGIIPDVFVPIDTLKTFNLKLYNNLSSFIFTYLDNHRSTLKKYKLDNFIQNFDLDNKIIDQYIKSQNINYPLATNEKDNLKIYFKALLARELFNETAFDKITFKNDNMILKVLALEKERLKN